MGSACCSYNDDESTADENQSAKSISKQDPNMQKFDQEPSCKTYQEPQTATATTRGSYKNLNLSIDIPVAWEYEPVLIKTMYSDEKIDLRVLIENKMVDYGLDFNDRLPVGFVNEVLNDDFFGQITSSR